MGELAIRHQYTSLSRQLGSMKVLEIELQRDCWASGTDNFSFGNTSIFISNFFWQWWSRRWKTSDTAFFPSLLSNLIRDLAKAYLIFIFFCPMGKRWFYFFHSRWKWKMPKRQILKRKYISGLSKHFVLINMPSWYIVFNLY